MALLFKHSRRFDGSQPYLQLHFWEKIYHKEYIYIYLMELMHIFYHVNSSDHKEPNGDTWINFRQISWSVRAEATFGDVWKVPIHRFWTIAVHGSLKFFSLFSDVWYAFSLFFIFQSAEMLLRLEMTFEHSKGHAYLYQYNGFFSAFYLWKWGGIVIATVFIYYYKQRITMVFKWI